MKKKAKDNEILNPWQEVKIHIVYDGHDVSIRDISHCDNAITITKTEAQYLKDVLNYLHLTPTK